jgi:hypothetical protein
MFQTSESAKCLARAVLTRCERDRQLLVSVASPGRATSCRSGFFKAKDHGKQEMQAGG